MLVDGERRWQGFTELQFNDDDFADIGAGFESTEGAIRIGRVGSAESRLCCQRPLVDFATTWMTAHR